MHYRSSAKIISDMTYLPIIGLEIHVQLKTKSKMFCSCDNTGDTKPINTTICPICMGHPGTLPVANKKAVEWSIKTALSLNCEIVKESKFDRKHYFYPDLPKGYQISQYDQPFGKAGWIKIKTQKKERKVRINRLHLEEDAAKLLHPEGGKSSLVDFNRAGTPLMEIVTEPDIRTPQEAGEFLRELRLLMRVLKISDADMEKGHLRCDANISLLSSEEWNEEDEMPIEKLSPKTEIKNLNSFKAVERALEYEIKRQTKLWDQGKPPKIQSTRGWDAEQCITVSQREKEQAHDYRYFPEPDIPPVKVKSKKGKVKSTSQKLKVSDGKEINLEEIKSQLPELPQAKRNRFVLDYDFSYGNAKILTSDYGLANFTEKVISELKAWLLSQEQAEGTEEEIWQKHKTKLAKMTANWLINKLGALINEKIDSWSELRITPENFAEFISLILLNKMNSRSAQEVLLEMLNTGKDPSNILEEKGLSQIDNKYELSSIIEQVISENESVVASYKNGKKTALQFLVGQVMRLTQGRAQPQLAARMLQEKIRKA